MRPETGLSFPGLGISGSIEKTKPRLITRLPPTAATTATISGTSPANSRTLRASASTALMPASKPSPTASPETRIASRSRSAMVPPAARR